MSLMIRQHGNGYGMLGSGIICIQMIPLPSIPCCLMTFGHPVRLENGAELNNDTQASQEDILIE